MQVKCTLSLRPSANPLRKTLFPLVLRGPEGSEKIGAVWLGNMVWVPLVSLDSVSNPDQSPWCFPFCFTQLCCDVILPFHSFDSFMSQSCSSITAIKFRHTHRPDKILDILSCLTSDSPPSSAPSWLGKLPPVSVDFNILGCSRTWNHITHGFCYWLLCFALKFFFFWKESYGAQGVLNLVYSRGQLRISDPSASISWVLGL